MKTLPQENNNDIAIISEWTPDLFVAFERKMLEKLFGKNISLPAFKLYILLGMKKERFSLNDCISLLKLPPQWHDAPKALLAELVDAGLIAGTEWNDENGECPPNNPRYQIRLVSYLEYDEHWLATDHAVVRGKTDPDVVWRKVIPPKKTYSPSPPVGAVYIIASERGDYKIGKSKNYKERKKWLDIKLPFKTELVHLIQTNEYHKLEIELHKKFESKRINGEWFKLEDIDIAWIKKTYGQEDN